MRNLQCNAAFLQFYSQKWPTDRKTHIPGWCGPAASHQRIGSLWVQHQTPNGVTTHLHLPNNTMQHTTTIAMLQMAPYSPCSNRLSRLNDGMDAPIYGETRASWPKGG